MPWPMPESAPVTRARRPLSSCASAGRGSKLATSIGGRLPTAQRSHVNGSSPGPGDPLCWPTPATRRLSPRSEQRGSALAYFKDDQEVYETIGKMFQDLADDPELGP